MDAAALYDAAALHAAGDARAALRSLRAFLEAADGRPLDAPTLEQAERIADAGVDARLRQEAFSLYPLLLAAGSTRYLTALRALEHALQKGDTAAAARVRAAWEPSETWGHVAAGWLACEQGDAAAAARHLLAAQEPAGQPFAAALRSATVLKTLPAAAAAELLLRLLPAWQAAFAPPDVEVLKLAPGRTVLQTGRVAAELHLALQSRHLTGPTVVPLLYMHAAVLEDEAGQALLQGLLERFPANAELRTGVINVHLLNRRFDAARAVCQQGAAAAAADDQRWAFKRFEVECYAGDVAAAEALLRTVDTTQLDQEQLLIVARLRAEQGRWEDVVHVLEAVLALVADPAPAVIDLLVRAVRATGRQAAALQTAAALPAFPQQQRLVLALLEDLAVQPGGAAGCLRVLREAGIAPPPLLAFKLEAAGAPALHAGRRSRDGRAIFWCADQAYVLPAAASMVSLLEANPGLRGAELFLVVDDALADVAGEAVAAVGRHFGVAASVRRASAIAPGAGALRTHYGLFTGGHQLATSAYWRIYMARALAAGRRHGELLYIDSDTIVREGFEAIFGLPREAGTLLLARPEMDRSEIRKAAALHGLAPGQYFNSGVLSFCRGGPELVARLREAERIAECEPQRLMFQDQCALNIAFAGAAAPLPETFNHYAGPLEAAAFGALPDGVACLVHALDRPKPWDGLYPAGTRPQRLWLAAARAFGRIAGGDALRELAAWTWGQTVPARPPQAQ